MAHRVLVSEDAEQVRRRLVTWLRGKGHEVVVCMIGAAMLSFWLAWMLYGPWRMRIELEPQDGKTLVTIDVTGTAHVPDPAQQVVDALSLLG